MTIKILILGCISIWFFSCTQKSMNKSQVPLGPLPDVEYIKKNDSIISTHHEYFVVRSTCEMASILTININKPVEISVRKINFGGRINTNIQHYDDYLVYLNSKPFQNKINNLDTNLILEMKEWIDGFETKLDNRSEDREFQVGSCTSSHVYFKNDNEKGLIKKIYPIGLNKEFQIKNNFIDSILEI